MGQDFVRGGPRATLLGQYNTLPYGLALSVCFTVFRVLGVGLGGLGFQVLLNVGFRCVRLRVLVGPGVGVFGVTQSARKSIFRRCASPGFFGAKAALSNGVASFRRAFTPCLRRQDLKARSHCRFIMFSGIWQQAATLSGVPAARHWQRPHQACRICTGNFGLLRLSKKKIPLLSVSFDEQSLAATGSHQPTAVLTDTAATGRRGVSLSYWSAMMSAAAGASSGTMTVLTSWPLPGYGVTAAHSLSSTPTKV